MTALNVTLVVATLAVFFWAPGLRRLTFGAIPTERQQTSRFLAWGALITAAAFGFIAVLTGARLDYDAYLLQWQMILDGQPPWGEHSRNAYGPLYNLLAWVYRIDPLLPKSLLVVAWVWSVVFISAKALQKHASPRPALALALLLWFSPLLPVLIPFYGFLDILPGALCILALHWRIEKRDGPAGAALAAAVLLKYYPLALLPFLMLDGRKVRWKLGVWCVLLIAGGMLLSYAAWGESTLYPLTFATDRESKWLSIFRFLRGPYSPLSVFMDDPNVDHLSTLSMVVFGGATWLLCWWKRVPLIPACIAGLAVGLQFYKVGHKQFQVPLVLLIAYAFAAEDWLTNPKRRSVIIATAAYFVWLTLFTLVYAVLRRVSRDGMLESIRDFTGLIGLVMTAWLVLPMLTLRDPDRSVSQTG